MPRRSQQPTDAIAPRLREQIYGQAMPLLAQGLASARRLKKPKAQDLVESYQMALTVLLRLMFIAYAEGRDLLPGRNSRHAGQRSLRLMARNLVKTYPHGLPDGESPFGTGSERWQDIA